MSVLAIAFIILLIIGMPIAVSVGISSLLFMLIDGKLPISVLVQRMTMATESWPLMAIPFFILLGQLCVFGSLGNRIMSFFNALVGHITGGTAHVSIVGNMFFAGVSGSSVADAAGIGSILIPQMDKEGFDTEFSVAINATASTIGIIIPPSIPMIVYAWMTNTSVQKMFMGGLIPGILIGLILMVIAYVIAKKRNYPKHPRATFKEILKCFKDNFLVLLIPVIILGSILLGIMSTTESAVMGVFYVAILQIFVLKELKFKDLVKIVCDSARTTGIIVFVIATSMILSHILTYEGIPQKVGRMMLQGVSDPVMILLIINTILLFLGTIMDVVPIIMIVTPVFFPIAMQIGMDPIQFGVMMTINVAMGLFTPPVGNTLYISCLLGKISMARGAKACIPFFFGVLCILMLVTFIPFFSTWIPSLMK